MVREIRACRPWIGIWITARIGIWIIARAHLSLSHWAVEQATRSDSHSLLMQENA